VDRRQGPTAERMRRWDLGADGGRRTVRTAASPLLSSAVVQAAATLGFIGNHQRQRTERLLDAGWTCCR